MGSRIRTIVVAAAALLLLAPAATGMGEAVAAETLKSGSFRGISGHRSSGDMSIVKDGNKLKVVFAKNFKLRDAPDATLAWGNNGYKKGTFFGKLRKLNGAQEYVIPAGTDLSKYNQFWLWCEKFNVGLAMAKLKN